MSTECVKNNNCSSSSNDLYIRHELYAFQDILNVCKAEDEEQRRRIADKEGENHKRVLANNLSVMFGENLHATWFQRGSSFVLSVLGSVRSVVAHTASDLSTTVSNKAGDLGHLAALRISSTAEDVGVKAQGAVQDVSNIISNKAGEMGAKAGEKAHLLSDSIAQKAGETASSVGLQAQAAALNLKGKGIETAHSVSGIAQEKAQDLLVKFDSVQGASRSWLSEKAQEYTNKLRSAVKMSFYKNLGSLTGHGNITFAMLEEEAERTRRMNCPSEKYAVQNAMKLASLVKGLNGESCDPCLHHSTRLLEEAERSRRVCEDSSDKAAIIRAKSVSDLIGQKFGVQEQLLSKKEIKSEFVAEENIKKPFAAAM